MQPTKQQIEALKGKCPECKGAGGEVGKPMEEGMCLLCQGTGNATITIPKEWVECPKCKNLENGGYYCNDCYKNTGKIQKYKVGDEINIAIHSSFCSKYIGGIIDLGCKPSCKTIKLKIISETETTQQLIIKR